MILRNAFLGTRRFDDFQQQLGMTRHVLAERLKRLVDEGVFRKEAYQPNRFEYRLTDKGKGLYPILLTLAAWGDQWMDCEGNGPPVVYFHKSCSSKTQPTLVCSECGEPIIARDMLPMAGPGLRPAK